MLNPSSPSPELIEVEIKRFLLSTFPDHKVVLIVESDEGFRLMVNHHDYLNTLSSFLLIHLTSL